ncbi:MAG TPA: hemolysin family protein [Devosiaceae bacterium]
MTDTKDQPPAAAQGPHRPEGDDTAQTETARRPSAWQRLKTLLNFRSPSLRADLREALEEPASEGTGSFSPSERAILQNVLKLSEVRVDDVMVPRADIDSVDGNEIMAALVARFRDAEHSRLPVYLDNLDNIIGMVHIKDALQRLTALNTGDAARDMPVRLLTPALRQKISKLDLVRKVLYVPPSMPVGDLLQSMQATRIHMAIVVDEYGGTDGLVTIEDLLEAVVGDIEDEHDEDDETLVRKVDENTFVADARAELDDLRELIGPDFEVAQHEDEVDTLGGLVLELIDRVPVRGEVISRLKGFEIEILAADARRVKKVQIIRRKRAARVRPKPPGEVVQKHETPESGQA